jgi:hypothetical protein
MFSSSLARHIDVFIIIITGKERNPTGIKIQRNCE